MRHSNKGNNMILSLTKDQSLRKRWEAGNGQANIYSVDGFFVTLNPEFDPAYVVDKFNPKVLTFETLEEAVKALSK
jgi:hypothetical protein